MKLSLSNFDAERFIDEYWQRKPMVIRNALSEWENPLPPDELAGLCCEFSDQDHTLNARLVIAPEPSNQNVVGQNWTLEDGPFDTSRFRQLPERCWTLLVDAVDTVDPNVADLRSAFDFLPSWRLDDVMVSYATQGGGVGPHFDRYDVFLVQVAGSRQWQIGQCCDSKTALQDDQPLTLLRQFDTQSEHILNPGDILYIPPHIAHWGMALDNDCMTYSVGYRAPSFGEILEDFGGFAATTLSNDLRYQDPKVDTTVQNGEINNAALTRIQEILQSATADKTLVEKWFGRFVTQGIQATLPSSEISDEYQIFEDLDDFRHSITNADIIVKSLDVRTAYTNDNAKTSLRFFVDGENYGYPIEWRSAIQTICRESDFPSEVFNQWLNTEDDTRQLMDWFNNGYFYIN